jgi:amino acid permease
MSGKRPDRPGERLRAAALLLPVLGAGAFAMPVAWAGDGGVGVAIYVFVAWAVLIVLAGWLSWRLSRRQGRE